MAVGFHSICSLLRLVCGRQAASSYEEKVKIFKEAHPKIIGKGGAQIKKIREETDTKIDLPRENSDSDVITITGRKENVQKARNMIENIQKELVRLFAFQHVRWLHFNENSWGIAFSCLFDVSSCVHD